MVLWTESIYSDGTKGFVSNPLPSLGEMVKVSVRCFADAPVKRVYLRQMVNGAEHWIEMREDRTERGLKYYACEILINEPHVSYHFAFACPDAVWFYNQRGVTDYLPDDSHDFVLLTDYPQPSWVRGAVMYQIFPERFCCGKKELSPADGTEFYGGDLYGIIDKIPYLRDLGVTVLYLNPIFTAYSSHKYDCIDYEHVDPHFGGDEALAELSKALHNEGMRLILDISINHTGRMHKWIREGRPYYCRREDGSFVGWAGLSSLPVLDYRNEEVKDLIYRGENAVLRKWLRPPYSIDGWRFDVADVFGRNDSVQLSDQLWKEVCAAIREENPEAFIIGEHWADCASYLQGDLWNSPMNYYGFGRIIRQFAGLPDLFLARVEGLREIPVRLSAAAADARTTDHYSRLPQVIADSQMNLFDSHDVSRMHNEPGIGFESFKSAVVAQLLWTGIPCIYYGDELAIDGYPQEDAGFRFPMPWGKISKQGEKHLELIRTMTHLRREIPAFAEGGRKVLLTDGRIFAAARFLGDEVYCGVISMEESERTVALPLKIAGVAVPAEDTDVFGVPVRGIAADDGSYHITVPAGRALLFKCR